MLQFKSDPSDGKYKASDRYEINIYIIKKEQIMVDLGLLFVFEKDSIISTGAIQSLKLKNARILSSRLKVL